MDAPNRTAHIGFIILGILALPLWCTIALFTLVTAFEIPSQISFLDLAPGLAILGAGCIACIAAVTISIWYAIYRKTTDYDTGLPVWIVLFGLTYCVNAVVFDGFVRRHMAEYVGGPIIRSYQEGIVVFAQKAEGWVIWAQFWPLIPMSVCAVLWFKSRTQNMSATAGGLSE